MTGERLKDPKELSGMASVELILEFLQSPDPVRVMKLETENMKAVVVLASCMQVTGAVCSLAFVVCRLSVVGCRLSVVGFRLSVVVCCLLFVACRLLFVVCCGLWVVSGGWWFVV